MTDHAVKSKPKDSAKTAKPPRPLTAPPVSSAGFNGLFLQRKASCACGGGCPSCRKNNTGLKVSSPNDAAEIEADRLADKIMRMPEGGVSPVNNVTRVKPSIHRKCSSCEDEEQKVQRKPLPAGGAQIPSQSPGHVREALLSGGRPLDRETRGFFEPRMGYDLGGVRLHTGAAAQKSARDLGAQAYTLGSSIVFGGEYRPGSETDKYLLAHELVHVARQNDGGLVHRKLKVAEKASDDPAGAIPTVKPMIAQLCPDFDVAADGEVAAKSGTNCEKKEFDKVAAGSQPVGCCCLCSLVSARTQPWKIIVTTKDAPQTDEEKKQVRMTPTSGAKAPQLSYWTGGASPAVTSLPFVEAFGHELCGHAALLEINAHAFGGARTDRAYSDVHDSTVKVENALATEMGLPGTRRGLAADGAHRGESLRIFTVGTYADDAVDAAPFTAQIAAAADFLNKNEDLMVDEIGFKTGSDTIAGIGKDRAGNVEKDLTKLVKKKDVKVETTPGKKENLKRIQPATDGGAPAGATAVVELRMAVEPAGLENPPGAKPPATPVHVRPGDPAYVRKLRAGGKGVNECHKLLAETGWK